MRFRKRLTRSAQLLTGSPRAADADADEAHAMRFSTAVDGTTMTVRGPVDLSTADSFRAALRRFSRGGTAELTVDLNGVTHLGSAGVQVLHEAHGLDGASLHLRASRDRSRNTCSSSCGCRTTTPRCDASQVVQPGDGW